MCDNFKYGGRHYLNLTNLTFSIRLLRPVKIHVDQTGFENIRKCTTKRLRLYVKIDTECKNVKWYTAAHLLSALNNDTL